MKTLRTLIFVLLAVAILAPQQADAQIWKRLKDRAEDRVKERLEQKAEEKVDEAVDRAVDRAWSSAEESVADAAAGAVSGMGNIFTAGMPANEIAPLGPNAAAPADAPYVRYVSTSRIDMGALGALTKFMGKDLLTTQETVTLDRLHQRTDQPDQSTFMDVEGERIVTLNHEEKTYSEMTFEQLASMMQSYAQQADEAADEEKPSADEQVDAEYRFDVRTEQTGRREDVNGTSAVQTLVIIETEAEAENTESGETMRGTFFTVADLWTADDLAGIETMRAFQQALAESLGKRMQQNASAAFGRMGQDPRLGPAMAQASAEMQKVTGYPVRSTMHFIVAPAGAELDLEAALAPPKEGEEGAGMAAMAQNMQQTEDGGTAVTEQTTMMRVTTQISDLQPIDGPGNAFTIPEGYKQVSMTGQ